MIVRICLALCLLSSSLAGLAADRFKVENPAGDTLVKFVFEEDGVKIKNPAGDVLLKGKTSDDDRKYKYPDGGLFAKVKRDDDGFKLKNERGGLMWKVKYYGDRIKISRDENNTRAAVLKRRGSDKWELELDERAAGKVKHYPKKDRTKAKGADDKEQYRIDGGRFSPALGVLLAARLRGVDSFLLMEEIALSLL